MWRYAWGDPVPGAGDLTLHDALRRAGAPAPPHVPLTDEVVRWAIELQQVDTPIVADGTGGLVIGMDAPELEPAVLLTTAEVARALGLGRATLDRLVVRGELPSHQLVVDGGRRWARPIVERCLVGAPRTDGRDAPGTALEDA